MTGSSNRSSVEPSSNPSSPSSSPAATPSSDQPKKRTRASKPKVRTGCITCKIRRVKCDEGKPACVRCTSTGRTCDGYDNAALTRYRSPDPAQMAELARAEFVRACEWNEALRSMRRIEAEIDGTETEKRVFARFRTATADGVASHLCSFAAFWRRITPSTGGQDEAVKHAVVALAAAYQLFQHPNEPLLDGFTRGDLELFTIQQYNMSIERLQRHAGPSSSESMRVTLVCCLAFISLETLRGNHDVAVTHLVNGLRILQSLPDSTFDYLADGSVFVWPPAQDTLHMPDIIQLFTRLELSACFFTHGIQAVISARGYRTRPFDDASAEGPFTDVCHARSTICCFQHDAMARMHEIAAATAGGDETAAAIFWSDPAQQRQQSCLLARGARLSELVADFFSPARFGTPDPITSDLQGLYLDLLYFYCAHSLISSASAAFQPGVAPFPYQPPPPLPVSTPAAPQNPGAAHVLLPSILHLASRLSASASADSTTLLSARRRPLTDIHTCLLGPLYLAATHFHDASPSIRAAAVNLLTDTVMFSLGYGHEHERRAGHNLQHQQHWQQQRQPQSQPQQHQGQDQGQHTLLAAAAAAAIGQVIEREVDEARHRARSNRLDGFFVSSSSSSPLYFSFSGETPRALVGAGCVPSLWDALASAGVMTLAGGS